MRCGANPDDGAATPRQGAIGVRGRDVDNGEPDVSDRSVRARLQRVVHAGAAQGPCDLLGPAGDLGREGLRRGDLEAGRVAGCGECGELRARDEADAAGEVGGGELGDEGAQDVAGRVGITGEGESAGSLEVEQHCAVGGVAERDEGGEGLGAFRIVDDGFLEQCRVGCRPGAGFGCDEWLDRVGVVLGQMQDDLGGRQGDRSEARQVALGRVAARREVEQGLPEGTDGHRWDRIAEGAFGLVAGGAGGGHGDPLADPTCALLELAASGELADDAGSGEGREAQVEGPHRGGGTPVTGAVDCCRSCVIGAGVRAIGPGRSVIGSAVCVIDA